MFDEMNSAWQNMPSVKNMTVEQLLDRIHYLDELHDTLPFEKWEQDWKSEYDVATIELDRRVVII